MLVNYINRINNVINLPVKFNLEYMGMFQVPGHPAACDWLQFSVHLGGNQSGSNFNARFEYVFVKQKYYMGSKLPLVWLIPCIQTPTEFKQTDMYMIGGTDMIRQVTAAQRSW